MQLIVVWAVWERVQQVKTMQRNKTGQVLKND